MVPQVQPVAELSELSRRSGQDGTEIVLDDSNIRGGTLRRSGSRRFNGTTTVSTQVVTSTKGHQRKRHIVFSVRTFCINGN